MIRALIACITLTLPTAALAEVDIQGVESPGGLTAWLVEEPSIPFTAININFLGGGLVDPEGKRGAVNLMTGLLEEGAGDLDAQAFARAREALAARYTFRAYTDSLTISAQMLTENRDEAVELLRLALMEPRFDQPALDRVRGQVEAGIRGDSQDPDEISGDAFLAAAFGDHPYGTDMDGTLESVAALTRQDMIDAHRAALVQDRMVIGIVGDITAEEAGLMIDRLLGDLPTGGPELPPEVPFGLEGGTTVIDYDSPQSTALFGHVGIERDSEDYVPAFILNHILGGGGFESRLTDQVREERGLTYGIATYLAPRELSEMILGRVRSSNDRIAEAIEVTRDIWADMAENGVTEAELEAAKTFLTGAYPLRFDGNGEIAGILAGMQRVGLPMDYVNFRNDLVEAVTLEEINALAADLLRPEELHFTIVGRPEGVN